MDYQIAGSPAMNSPPESFTWQGFNNPLANSQEEWRPTSNYVSEPMSDFPGLKIITTLA